MNTSIWYNDWRVFASLIVMLLNEPSTTRTPLIFCYQWFYFFKASETFKCSIQRRHVLLPGKFLFVQNILRICTKSSLKNVPYFGDRILFLAKNSLATVRWKYQLKYVQLIIIWCWKLKKRKNEVWNEAEVELRNGDMLFKLNNWLE